jgi:hypothetical protein
VGQSAQYATSLGTGTSRNAYQHAIPGEKAVTAAHLRDQIGDTIAVSDFFAMEVCDDAFPFQVCGFAGRAAGFVLPEHAGDGAAACFGRSNA